MTRIKANAMSCITSIPIVTLPIGLFVSFDSINPFITIVVEDIARTHPRKHDDFTLIPAKAPIPMAKAITAVICISPPHIATRLTRMRLLTENSHPSPKRRKVAPSCANVSTCTNCWMRPRQPGPITEPPIKYPNNMGWPNADAMAPLIADPEMRIPMSTSKVLSICDEASPGEDSMYSFFSASTRTFVSASFPLRVILTTCSTFLSVSSSVYFFLSTLLVRLDSLFLFSNFNSRSFFSTEAYDPNRCPLLKFSRRR
mmetsp:Transcript_3060/g.4429  ORF Transcript_3060/g.4429 Transcript_3060/m.4429 type:complete len:257 (+) Transcript_3060:884-1654(+)